MNFLAPLFLFGALAVAAPIVFHLIRRTSREKIPFSSLMFLMPTPPRVTRRSKLEHILLLLLRCLVLGLLAMGFARPFLQQAFDPDPPAGQEKKIVLLMDTSASMRRDGLWSAAQAKAEAILRKASPADQIAVVTFDRAAQRLVSFEQWSAMNAGERATLVAGQLAQIKPGWSSTHLGNALVTAAELIEESAHPQQPSTGPRQIVLISDLQEGSRMDALQAFEWPKDIEVIIEPVKARRPTNAGLQLVADLEDTMNSAAEETSRVRVSNSTDAKREQFKFGWRRAGDLGLAGAAAEVYVPPGQGRIFAAPKAPPGAAADLLLGLQGDDDDFDNAVYVVPAEIGRINILYLGRDSDKDTGGPLYFVQRAFQQTRRQTVQIVPRTPDAPIGTPEISGASLVIVTDPLPEAQLQPLRAALRAGKTALVMMKDASAAATLAGLLEIAPLSAEEAPAGGYAMLGEIDFQHPLFAPFADPRFSDFTKIHFWKHRRLAADGIPAVRILARFDSGAPAFLEAPVGKGRVLALMSGWHPADSQLALASKFVPLLYAILEQSGGISTRPTQYSVGDTVVVRSPSGATNETLSVRKPDGTEVSLAGGAAFSNTDLPGVYTVTGPQGSQRFAVNLDASESRTAPLPLDELERLGVSMKPPEVSAAKKEQQKKHLQNTELENKQKLWRWLIFAALVVLILETWLSGWLTRRVTAEAAA